MDLPEGSVVVDVGAGIGAHSLVLARAFEHLQIVVQDRAPVIADAEKVVVYGTVCELLTDIF